MIRPIAELNEPEASGALVLAGYLLAGAPPSMVEIYLRPGRTPDERRRLVLLLSGREPQQSATIRHSLS